MNPSFLEEAGVGSRWFAPAALCTAGDVFRALFCEVTLFRTDSNVWRLHGSLRYAAAADDGVILVLPLNLGGATQCKY